MPPPKLSQLKVLTDQVAALAARLDKLEAKPQVVLADMLKPVVTKPDDSGADKLPQPENQFTQSVTPLPINQSMRQVGCMVIDQA